MQIVSKNLKHEIYFFLIAGCLGVSIDFVIYFLLHNIFGTLLAKITSFYTGVVFTYFFNKNITFSKKDLKKFNKNYLFKYFTLLTFTMSINTLINEFMLIIINNDYSFYFSFIIATSVSMLVNFTLMKFWIFK